MPITNAAETIKIGDLSVRRFGYGTATLTGFGVWGYPPDRAEAIRVVRRAVDLGVNFIDTADSYGPHTAEELIREALHPYPKDLVIASKGGQIRAGMHNFLPMGRPDFLRHACDLSLFRLGLDCLDIYQLHRPDPEVPLAESVGALIDLQKAGKIRHIGASNVTPAQLAEFMSLTPIVSVQGWYNVIDRRSEEILRICEAKGILMLPYFPLGNSRLLQPGGPLSGISQRSGIPPAQLALAWLLQRSKSLLPFPGTVKMAELEQNIGATQITLSPEVVAELDALQLSQEAIAKLDQLRLSPESAPKAD